MFKWILRGFVIAILSLCGCGMRTEPFIRDCTGRTYLTFTLLKEGSVTKNDSLLSDSSTYFVMSRLVNKDTLFSFIKFYPQGYFIQSSSLNKKTDFLPENAYEISYRCGYFNHTDSIITMQTWVDNYDGMYIGKARLKNDSLIYYYFLNKKNGKKIESNLFDVYIKENGTSWIH